MNKDGQSGFTLLELVLAIGLLGLLMPVIATMLRQTVIQTDRNTTRITALTPLENVGRWLGRDVPLAQAISLSSVVPGVVTQVSLYWTDWSDSGNYDQYSASSAAYKRVRATYALSPPAGITLSQCIALSKCILTRTMATCANQYDTDVFCTALPVLGAPWTVNTGWVSGQKVLTSSGIFNQCSRALTPGSCSPTPFATPIPGPASPSPVARDLATFQVSLSMKTVTVDVTSSPKGAASPTESRRYLIYASLLGVGDPIQ